MQQKLDDSRLCWSEWNSLNRSASPVWEMRLSPTQPSRGPERQRGGKNGVALCGMAAKPSQCGPQALPGAAAETKPERRPRQTRHQNTRR